MKKKLSGMMCLLIVFVLAFTFFGCDEKKDNGDDKDGKVSVVGTWEGTVDMTDMMKMILDGMGANIKIEPGSCKVKSVYVFNEDGTYSNTPDVNDIRNVYKTTMTPFIESTAKDAGITVEALLEQMQMDSIDAFIDSLMEATGDLKEEGKYLIEDNKLYTSSDVKEDVDKDTYEVIKITKTELTFEKLFVSGKEEDAEGMYPMTFKKK